MSPPDALVGDPAAVAAPAAERDGIAFLADVGQELAAALDEEEVAERLVRFIVPVLADSCSVVLFDGEGRLARVAQRMATPEVERAVAALRAEPRDDASAPVVTALRTGEAQHVRDTADWLVAPVRARGRPIGVLSLVAVEPRRFAPGDVALAAQIGERAGLALDNARLFAAAERARLDAVRENRINETLIRLGGSFARERDEQRLLQLVTDEATAATGAAFGAFFWNADGGGHGAYELFTLSGLPREVFAGFPMPRATPIFGPTFRGEGTLRLDDVRADPRHGALGPQPPGHPPVRSYLAAPVIDRDGAVLGGLFFGHPEPGRFTPYHERLVVGIAGQAAIAIENARLVQALRASEARARAADRRKDEFLAILGHELRNPLAPIVTALELMKLREPGGRRERDVIERQVQHLSRLVDDLLDVSRITRGVLELRRERVEVGAVIAEAIQRTSPLLEQRRQHLAVVAGDGLAIDADFGRMTQVLTNLLHNAAKYTPPGGHIRIEARRDDDEIVLEVRDDGSGIEPDLLDAIFEPFVQNARTRDRAEGGLGIGLALVRSLVELHGGSIAVASEGRGHGATFALRLPAVAPGALAAGTPAAPEAATTGRRILVVDDNADAADLLAEALAACGHHVEVARDGAQALAVAAAFRPDVAVLDIGLPVMDGYELAARLRRDHGDRPLRLIALTGYGQDDDRARARDAGFDDHVVKPADLGALLRSIDP